MGAGVLPRRGRVLKGARHLGPCCPPGHTTPGPKLGPKGLLLLPWTCPDLFRMTLGQI